MSIDSLAHRVAYAKRCYLNGKTDSRDFDNCFEVYDGALVVTALMRKARQDTALADALLKDFSADRLEDLTWFKTAQWYASLSDRSLHKMSRQVQSEAAFLRDTVFLPGLNRDGEFWAIRRTSSTGRTCGQSFRATSLEDAQQFVRSWVHDATEEGEPYNLGKLEIYKVGETASVIFDEKPADMLV